MNQVDQVHRTYQEAFRALTHALLAFSKAVELYRDMENLDLYCELKDPLQLNWVLDQLRRTFQKVFQDLVDASHAFGQTADFYYKAKDVYHQPKTGPPIRLQ